MRLFDIGGSGVKTVKLTSNEGIEILGGQDVAHFPEPDWSNFIEWALHRGLLESDVIGIACAGFVENNQNIKLFRVGGWAEKLLANEILEIFPSSIVHILNDAEAHLIAHVGIFDSPCMSISLGTSLGFAISNNTGGIVRPPDSINFDVGELAIPTRASNNRVWFALGAAGLRELENDLGKVAGRIQFGHRLGGFLASMCSIFRPRSIVLSGGITDNAWDIFEPSMQSEFICQIPDWIEAPEIIRSPFGRNAALIGIAKYTKSQHELSRKSNESALCRLTGIKADKKNKIITESDWDRDEISDGYHTFGELYAHRVELFIALCRKIAECEDSIRQKAMKVWRSMRHSDGSQLQGWFLMGIGLSQGEQITYHLPVEKWGATHFAHTLDTAPEFDGHTSENVLKRLRRL